MKKGVDLESLAKKLEATKRSSVDFVVPTTKISMNNDSSLNFKVGDDYHVAKMTDHAHTQVAQWAKIPTRYYSRMQDTQPELLANNVNTWLHANQKAGRMIRAINQSLGNNVVSIRPESSDLKVRAFLSNRYRRIDNWAIADTTLSTLSEINDKAGLKATVASSELTESSMYIKIVFEALQREIKVGDAVRFGLIVRNSEIGLGRAVVAGFTERLVCTNGMVMQSNFCKTHLGIAIDEQDEALGYYSDETLAAEDRAVQMKLRDAIKGILSQDNIDEMAFTMMAATTSEELRNPKKAVEEVGQKLGMNESEQDSILYHLARDGDLTKWGLANAVTRTAEDLPSYDRATEFEGFGFNVLKLSDREWNRLAAKAA